MLSNCTVEVAHNELLAASTGRSSVGKYITTFNHSFLQATYNIGLPASSIALSRQRLYWSSMNSPGIFSVNRSVNEAVNVLSETAEALLIVTLNPDQQLIPGRP